MLSLTSKLSHKSINSTDKYGKKKFEIRNKYKLNENIHNTNIYIVAENYWKITIKIIYVIFFYLFK